MNLKSLLIIAAILTAGNAYSFSDDSLVARGGGGGERGGMGGHESGDFNRGQSSDFNRGVDNRGSDNHPAGRDAVGLDAAHNRGETQGEVNGFNAGMDIAPAYNAAPAQYYPDPNQQQPYYPSNP
jgi:hypothetical protein